MRSKAKQLAPKELDSAEARLMAGEQPLRVAKILGLSNGQQLTRQLGAERWGRIKAHRLTQRSGWIRKAGAAAMGGAKR